MRGTFGLAVKWIVPHSCPNPESAAAVEGPCNLGQAKELECNWTQLAAPVCIDYTCCVQASPQPAPARHIRLPTALPAAARR